MLFTDIKQYQQVTIHAPGEDDHGAVGTVRKLYPGTVDGDRVLVRFHGKPFDTLTDAWALRPYTEPALSSR